MVTEEPASERVSPYPAALQLGTGAEHLCRQQQRFLLFPLFTGLDDFLFVGQAVHDQACIGGAIRFQYGMNRIGHGLG